MRWARLAARKKGDFGYDFAMDLLWRNVRAKDRRSIFAWREGGAFDRNSGEPGTFD